MRRSALAMLAATLAAAAVLAIGRGGGGTPRPLGARADPRQAAQRAHDLALAEPLVVTLVTGGGHEVARAVVGAGAGTVELAAAGLTGVQDGDRLHALGTTVEVPALDRARLLVPLVDRPARWEGRHLRLDGSPPAQAWLAVDGRLARLELDLGAGGRLVVTPAR